PAGSTDGLRRVHLQRGHAPGVARPWGGGIRPGSGPDRAAGAAGAAPPAGPPQARRRGGRPARGRRQPGVSLRARGPLRGRRSHAGRSSNGAGSAGADAQAAYESGMSIWGAVLGGASLLYQGAGWLEGGLTASFEKLILDAELLQQMTRVLEPPTIDDEGLGLD